MLKHITATALLGLTLAVPAAGQTRNPEQANKPKTLMQQRIKSGVRNGQISKEGLAAIRQRLQAFRQELKAKRADGTVTRQERRTLKQQWRQISRQVFRAKHKK